MYLVGGWHAGWGLVSQAKKKPLIFLYKGKAAYEYINKNLMEFLNHYHYKYSVSSSFRFPKERGKKKVSTHSYRWLICSRWYASVIVGVSDAPHPAKKKAGPGRVMDIKVY